MVFVLAHCSCCLHGTEQVGVLLGLSGVIAPHVLLLGVTEKLEDVTDCFRNPLELIGCNWTRTVWMKDQLQSSELFTYFTYSRGFVSWES